MPKTDVRHTSTLQEVSGVHLCWGTPPSTPCLYPLQASWHPLQKRRTAHHSAGTQFLFLARLWNTEARLPVEGPAYPSVMWKYILPWPQGSTRHRVQVSICCFVITRQERTHIDIPCTIKQPWTSAHTIVQLLKKTKPIGNKCLVLIRVKTYSLI